jgi:hypothetical protein|tara:strand:- start:50 stop:1330 length:1281 start_codon:yes stop_codon:yes gene_type:complete
MSNTAKQEDCSILFFKEHCDKRFNLSDKQYAELDKKAFGKSGVYPQANAIWRRSYDEQVIGLMNYMISRGISTTGWSWSRDQANGMMNFLNKIAQQKGGVTGSLDSWNPMDVVAVKKSEEVKIKKRITEMCDTGDKLLNLNNLNVLMEEYIRDKKLMPISLKQVGKNEKGTFEMSSKLKTREAKRRSLHDFTADNFVCDLAWNADANEWKFAQEISWDMIDKGGGGREGLSVHVQGRTFQAKQPREKPQHSGAAIGATGAMLGKASVGKLDSFVKKCGLTEVPAPAKHPHIPSPGTVWSNADKQYWIKLYNTLSSVRIDGKKIDFGKPGKYGEGTNIIEQGFEAALNEACLADQRGARTKTGRSAGSRLTAKLWGLEWLHRYYMISKKVKFDAFMQVLVDAMKKESETAGPFIKVFGKPGLSAKRY